MSDKQFVFTLVTPEERLVKPTPAVSVTAFGLEGAFTALPGHTPFLTPLKDGTLVKYRTPSDEDVIYYVDAGIIEVLPGRVSVLAESALLESELDHDQLARQLADAKRRCEEAKKSDERLKPGEPGKPLPDLTEKKLLEIGELEVMIVRSTRRLKHLDKKKRV
jgi:F-type H+-transporting ATPase subunit epsilon